MPNSSAPTYLFVGDSLTEGIYGESYVTRIEEVVGKGQVANVSSRYITASSLLRRIEEPLRRCQPRWVILAVGSNDVWLPWLSGHSLGWGLWSIYLRIMRGQTVTTDLDEFAALYRALIETSQFVAGSRVLVCTASPLGERFSSPVNRQLARLNGVLKQVATDCNVPVADVWQAFVDELAGLPSRSSYLPTEWLFTWLDQRRLRTSSPDEIGHRRKLHLTFDGIHLNSRGAELWATTVLNALMAIKRSNVAHPFRFESVASDLDT